MDSIHQALKTEILKLLFASTWQSQEITITYQSFATLVRNFAQRFHSERPVLTALLDDIDEALKPIIEQLIAEEQFVVRKNTRDEIITIEYRGYYLTATNHWYKRLEKDIEAPFANNQVFKLTIPQDLYITIPLEELNTRFVDLIGYEKLIVLQFAGSLNEVIVTAELLQDKLPKICLKKIEKYISQRQLLSEIGERMSLSSEELLRMKNLLESISESPTQEINRIESGNAQSFKLWTTVNKILQDEFKENSDISATYESYYQAICILHQIILLYHRVRVESELKMKKEEYVFNTLSQEPYIFRFSEIKNNYTKLLEEDALSIETENELEQLIQSFISKNTNNAYPGVTKFDGLDGNIYYALTPRLAEVLLSQIQAMRGQFKQYYHSCYSNWIRSRISYPFINNEQKLEYDLENRLRDNFPRLYALLNFATISDCIWQAQQFLPSFPNSSKEKLLQSLIDRKTESINAYSIICNLSNKALLESAKQTAPLWTLIPGLNAIIYFFKNWFDRLARKTKTVSVKVSAAASSGQPEQIASFNSTGSELEGAETTAASSAREQNIADLRSFIGSEAEAHSQLAAYLRNWNQIATEPERTNLTKDVNALCRDSIRSVMRKNRSYVPNAERIVDLADRISKNKVFASIKQKESLKNYLVLYSTLHVLAQIKR